MSRIRHSHFLDDKGISKFRYMELINFTYQYGSYKEIITNGDNPNNIKWANHNIYIIENACMAACACNNKLYDCILSAVTTHGATYDKLVKCNSSVDKNLYFLYKRNYYVQLDKMY